MAGLGSIGLSLDFPWIDTPLYRGHLALSSDVESVIIELGLGK